MPIMPQTSSFRAREFAIPGVAALVLIFAGFWFAPASVFLLNANEVAHPVGDVIAASGVWQIALAALVLVLCVLVGEKGRRVLNAVLLALAALLYLQGNLLAWDYGRLDGTDIDWSRHRIAGIFEVVLWLGLMVSAVVFRKRLWRFGFRAALFILLLHSLSLGASLLAGRTFTHGSASGMDDRIHEFSHRKNVLIVILDAFAAPAFDLMLDRDPSWKDRLDGFTYYQDALGVYPSTLPSIPAILSGKAYENAEPLSRFLQENLAENSLPTVLRDHGFRTHTVSETIYGQYLEDVPFSDQISFLDPLPRNRRMRDSLRIWNVTLFRYAPHFLKMRVYSDHKWLLAGSRDRDDSASPPETGFSDADSLRVPTPGQSASWILWRQMVDNARAAGSEPTFKFIHIFTTHLPFFMDGNCRQITKEQYAEWGWVPAIIEQSTCAMTQVEELLDRMRELEVLDRTLVILAADHGNHINLLAGENDDPEWQPIPGVSKVLPLLLVKPMGAAGPLKVSQAPVSLADIPRTVAADMGVSHEFPGQSFQATGEDETRTRVYFDYQWEHRFWFTDHLPAMQEFRVRGPARDPASWHRGRVLDHVPHEE